MVHNVALEPLSKPPGNFSLFELAVRLQRYDCVSAVSCLLSITSHSFYYPIWSGTARPITGLNDLYHSNKILFLASN